MHRLWIPFSFLVFALACGSSDGGTDSGPGNDLSTPDAVQTDPGDDPGTIEDVPPIEDPGDTADEGPADVPDPQDPGHDEGDTFQLPDVDIPYPARSLPFAYTRPAEGTPLPDEEVSAFTRDIAATYKAVGYFRWMLRTSTGVDASTGMDDFLAWYRGTKAWKEDGVVTFHDSSSEHNMWIPGSIVLSSVLNGYLLTGDWELAKLTEQYCKGLTAVVKGFVRGEDDPAPYLMARAVFPMNQDFVLDADHWKDDGRRKVVVYDPSEEDRWNAQTFPWPDNPTWGDIWVTNMRSKDDVRAISRTMTFLHYVVEDAGDAWVRTACRETFDTLKAFHQDIVDSGYHIRTKDRDGNPYVIPCEVQDLGSYACYMELDPANECCARLSADLIAFGERRTNDCGTCTGSLFDAFATTTHYYNYPIVWDYHMAALGNALVHGQLADAYPLMVGLDERIDSYMHPSQDESGPSNERWNSDMAVLLVQAASMGLPLTAAEARHVHQHFARAAELFRQWDRWDLWDASVPDTDAANAYSIRPPDAQDAVKVESFAILFEYCNSPFKNPAGAAFVDCDVLADPSGW